MDIPLISTEAVEFEGILKKVEKMGVHKGDILILRFNPLMNITKQTVDAYAMKLYRAAGGKVSVIPMPQGMALEKVEVAVREHIMEEIAAQAKKAMVAAGIDPEKGMAEVRARLVEGKTDATA